MVILIIIGIAVVLFFTLKKTKCENCGNETNEIINISNKKICYQCLDKNHTLGYAQYRNEVLKDYDITQEDLLEYEKYVTSIYDDKSLVYQQGQLFQIKSITTIGAVICPTVIISTQYRDLIFRTKDIVAVSIENCYDLKYVKNDILAFVITFYTNNNKIPYLQTCIFGKNKFFDFSMGKDIIKRIEEIINSELKIGTVNIEMPFLSMGKLKKYIKDNNELLKEKNILTEEFTLEKFCENIERSECYNLDKLSNNEYIQSTEFNENMNKIHAYLNKIGFIYSSVIVDLEGV